MRRWSEFAASARKSQRRKSARGVQTASAFRCHRVRCGACAGHDVRVCACSGARGYLDLFSALLFRRFCEAPAVVGVVLQEFSAADEGDSQQNERCCQACEEEIGDECIFLDPGIKHAEEKNNRECRIQHDEYLDERLFRPRGGVSPRHEGVHDSANYREYG